MATFTVIYNTMTDGESNGPQSFDVESPSIHEVAESIGSDPRLANLQSATVWHGNTLIAALTKGKADSTSLLVKNQINWQLNVKGKNGERWMISTFVYLD